MIDKQIEYWAHMLDECFNKDEIDNSLTNELLNETDVVAIFQTKLNTLADSIILFNEVKNYIKSSISNFKKYYDKIDNISKFDKNLRIATRSFNQIVNFLTKLIEEKNDPQYSLTKKTPGAKEFFKDEMHQAQDGQHAVNAIYLFVYNLGKELKYGKDANPLKYRKVLITDPKDDIAWWYTLTRFKFSLNMIDCCNFVSNLEYSEYFKYRMSKMSNQLNEGISSTMRVIETKLNTFQLML